MERVKVRLVMEERRRPDVYPAEVLADIDRIADLARPFLTAQELADQPDALRDTEVLLTGWGAPVIDAALLERAPRLRAVLHAAGSVKHIVTDAAWERGVVVVSAASANAEPVAAMTAAQILLAARGVQASRRVYRAERSLAASRVASGARGSVVGLVALGEIGRRVAERLRGTGVRMLAADPFASAETAAELGVELVPLEELFSDSDVVSLHAPLLPSTTGMIGAALLERMPRDATLINTARGGLIDEPALIDVLSRRGDLTALLDVTVTEPPASDSPLWALENVELTPHVAGSMGADRAGMGQLVCDELERLIEGGSLRHEITREALARTA
ncbi:phosphoglycerate dehydrogenase-like enzyme [Microbacterium natoriense]|uniref:Phosphoglycerate dehydrogenase-like enzyme n=1 Tax=Microbacterium natoriense TaxID=284570 RepID=A0AAW8F519_9MICO|nr:hydroxyacid dehydrogenase [Microbacterium natoriense]MDQ0649546.1 phosphoglycerate dehydrogenase-like enzyme [Microbacterium natoriense]